jgi:hypothetical protein
MISKLVDLLTANAVFIVRSNSTINIQRTLVSCILLCFVSTINFHVVTLTVVSCYSDGGRVDVFVSMCVLNVHDVGKRAVIIIIIINCRSSLTTCLISKFFLP